MGKVERISLPEAIACIPDGSCLTFSGFTIWRRPMEAIYELIRQKKKDLHLVEVNGVNWSGVCKDLGKLLDRA